MPSHNLCCCVFAASIESVVEMPTNPVCIVLACDSNYFFHLRACLDTLAEWPTSIGYDVKVIGIDLSCDELRWLRSRGVDVLTDIERFPLFPDAPRHYAAMTCRPYIPETFPGYRAYMSVDTDIRFLTGEGLDFFLQNALDPDTDLVISHVTDPSYPFIKNPSHAAERRISQYDRIRQAYGAETAEYFRYYEIHCAGIFSARADSPIWQRYKRNLKKTMPLGAHWCREQDALNVALVEVGSVKEAPSIYNWLCIYSVPVRTEDGAWVSPAERSRKISVAHLLGSGERCHVPGFVGTNYGFYKQIGLTK